MSRIGEIEPCKFIFVVGTPGVGKSSFCNELSLILRANKIKSSRHGDYPCLLQLFENDKKNGRGDRFKSGGDTAADFEVIDLAIYDEALRLVCKKVLARSPAPKSVKIIEFARPNYDNAFVYYTLSALLQSVIIHVTAPLPVCLYRNDRRREIIESRDQGGSRIGSSKKDLDLHFVPEKVMRNYYAKDKAEYEQRNQSQKLVLSLLPARGYLSIENSTDGLTGFRAAAGKIVQNDLLPLILKGEQYEEYYDRRLKELGTRLGSFGKAV